MTSPTELIIKHIYMIEGESFKTGFLNLLKLKTKTSEHQLGTIQAKIINILNNLLRKDDLEKSLNLFKSCYHSCLPVENLTKEKCIQISINLSQILKSNDSHKLISLFKEYNVLLFFVKDDSFFKIFRRLILFYLITLTL
ncbi:hypothetical protein LDVICp106 [lymphocystis disease virus-China]|uniref:Uncharacterized protein n=2 Tax=Lymphocystis disease virus 2 TaxID=159183 RepID=A0A6F8X003_9VIRU|nr:hypothetical protein LDVICp106 [lymphocystis disease virus-China]AAU10951.1 hypothetical protein [lymphocystis disease virus-China]BCB67472.1 hypothetical protein [Lymphocystis disease virus 2]